MVARYLRRWEKNEGNNYICYSAFGRKFKGKLSDVSYVGYLPLGVDGAYQIKYGTEKTLPFFCLFGKKKMKELYETVKRKILIASMDFKKISKGRTSAMCTII